MVKLFANNAHGTLAAPMTGGDLTLTLDTGQGASFPNPGSGDDFIVSIERANLTAFEIVLCTLRGADVLTIERGLEGTTPTTFSIGDRVRCRPTAGMFEDFFDLLDAEQSDFSLAWAGMGISAGGVVDWGVPYTTPAGTISVPAMSGASQQASISGQQYVATTALQVIGSHYGITQGRVWRGNSTNRGGFDVYHRFALVTDLAPTYLFVGFDSGTGTYTPAATSPGLRTTTAQCGFGFNLSTSAGSDILLFHNDGGGGAVTAIGTGIARDVLSTFTARFYAPPFANYIEVTLTNHRTRQVFGPYTILDTDTGGLPPNTTFLLNRCVQSGSIGQTLKFYGYWRKNVNQSEPT